jgi:PAS domain S-box-containing protein
MCMPPGWDGLETLSHLWDVDPWLQIVICSAHADQPWDTIIDKYGNSDRLLILRKPFDRVEALQLALTLTTKWTVAREAEAECREQKVSRWHRTRQQQEVVIRLSTDRSLRNCGLETAAQTITQLTAEAVEVERVSIWLLSEDRAWLECVDLYERSRGLHSCPATLCADDCLGYFEALKTERLIRACDALEDRRTQGLSAYLSGLGITSMLDAAVRISGEVAGVVCVEQVGPPRAWHEDEVAFVAVIADQTAQLLTEAKRQQAEEALRESESRLKTIVEAIQAGLLVIDAETHVIVEVNPAALAMLGAPREDVVGRKCHQYVCPAQQDRCPVADLGQTLDRAERTLIKADGKRVSILKTVVPILLHGRKHLLECFIDITERKQVEAELAAHREGLEELVAQRTRQLLEAERQVLQTEKLASVGRLAAGVAHEINTPIQYVGDNLHALADIFQDLRGLVDQYRALADMAAGAQLNPEAVELIRAAEEEIDLPFVLEDAPKAIAQGLDGVQRVASIVRAMKDFSHVKGGVVASVDLNHALQSTLTVAKNEYKYHADVETDFGDLPSVECYPSELNQVFLNLLVNAAHAIEDKGGGRGKITITTREAGSEVEIAITDSGVGIPPEIRDKIYDLFFTTKPVGRGTGQGLYLAHQIVVTKHGGTLACESEVGVGTTFRIRIPVRLAIPPEVGGSGDAELDAARQVVAAPKPTEAKPESIHVGLPIL